MFRLVLLGLFVASVALVAGAVALVKVLGWWAAPLLFVAFVGLAWGAKKLAGERRLRVLVGVQPAMRSARFRYYFELFGEVSLPA